MNDDHKETRIVCDVDMTLVDSVFSPQNNWLDELKQNCTLFDEDKFIEDRRDNNLTYELYSYFNFNKDYDVMSYWKQLGLYNNMLPLLFSVQTLDYFHKCGYKIIILTHMDDSLSKRDWCYKHFPFIDSYIQTGDKHEVIRENDILIDDRLEYLNPCNCKMKILIGSCNRQYPLEVMKATRNDDITHADDWCDVFRILNETLGDK